MLEPKVPRAFPVPSEPKVMNQSGFAFVPSVLVVRKGQPVRFENGEGVLHNVRVAEAATDSPVFNIATIPGGSYEHTFQRDGFYAVRCDVHADMHADILVTSTPYAVIADDDGQFRISDVSPGPYRLTVYAAGQKIERLVEVAEAQTELVVEEK